MTTPTDEALLKQQQEIQRWLGRCLLLLQRYERQIKLIVAHHKISGPVHDLVRLKKARIDSTAGRTLGQLVGDFLGSYAVTEEINDADDAAINAPEAPPSISFECQMKLSDAEFARIESGLKELVLIRNNLVHHFEDKHDLWSLEGCRVARAALEADYNRIRQHTQTLRIWVEEMEEMRRLMAEFMLSDIGHDLIVNGVGPDGSLILPTAAFENALNKAISELTVDGWVSIDEAASWIVEQFPKRLPSNFGYKSWRQVVHKLRAFELQYFEVDGKRTAMYRKKES